MRQLRTILAVYDLPRAQNNCLKGSEWTETVSTFETKISSQSVEVKPSKRLRARGLGVTGGR